MAASTATSTTDERNLLGRTREALRAQALKQAAQTKPTFKSSFKFNTDYQHIKTSTYGK